MPELPQYSPTWFDFIQTLQNSTQHWETGGRQKLPKDLGTVQWFVGQAVVLSFQLLFSYYFKLQKIFASSGVQVFFQNPLHLHLYSGHRQIPPVSVTDPWGLFCSGKCQVMLTSFTMYSFVCSCVSFWAQRRLQNAVSQEHCTDTQKHIKWCWMFQGTQHYTGVLHRNTHNRLSESKFLN